MTALFGNGVMHAKFLIVDGASFYLGSANFDWRSLTQVKEMGVRVRGCPLLATDLEKNFEAYWIAGQLNAVPAEWPANLTTTYDYETPAKVSINGAPGSGTLIFVTFPPHSPHSSNVQPTFPTRRHHFARQAGHLTLQRS